jgi:hypothetical protein
MLQVHIILLQAAVEQVDIRAVCAAREDWVAAVLARHEAQLTLRLRMDRLKLVAVAVVVQMVFYRQLADPGLLLLDIPLHNTHKPVPQVA